MNNIPNEYEKEKMIDTYVRDSFDSSDSINKIDWSKTQDPDIKNLIDYTTGLIKLRRSTDAFSLGDKNLVDSSVKLSYCDSVETNGQAIVYETKATNGDKYFIFVNATNYTKDFETTHIDLSDAIVIVDSDEAGTTEVSKLSGVNIYTNKVTLEGVTAVVFKKEN